MREDIKEILKKQRDFFNSGRTLSIGFRLKSLKKLRSVVLEYEDLILDALKKDVGKSAFEGYVTEVHQVKSELKYHISRLRKWARPEKTRIPLLHLFSKSCITSRPYGVVLVISPWNFPFNLAFIPLIGAISGGNCVLLKPSSFSAETTAVMRKIIGKSFIPEHVTMIEGGRDVNKKILEFRYDYIFFTGGKETGRIVMEKASKYLTPITLELGGKCPCIVDAEAHLESSARRIVWGKFLNVGQMCLAPDYLLVDRKIKDEFVERLKQTITKFYGENPRNSPDYGRIINERHFDRIVALLEDVKVIFGGESDRNELYIAPTLIDEVSLLDKIMQEEIFGPLLPIIHYETLDEAVEIVKKLPVPLACYFFSRNKKKREFILRNIEAGGICINDTVIHFDNKYLPFGGKGESGLGRYHGRASFDTFTYRQSIMIRNNKREIGLRYPPFKDRLKVLRRFI